MWWARHNEALVFRGGIMEIWKNHEEAEALNEDVDGYIPWFNNKPPLLAPK
ncbi:hypothetical protein HCH_03220 [Hahella chejuensis KCTC 2396]|uniref:Uncharacterized protein n=1 Tax=Hahella chejuensis (strain KCTC 2396) TaxID=349521 RepID=Q2SH93_HAHCH|nr:hypothetical protein HCH_03220 [Hahella chejuensis KCTC 2396]